MLSDKLECGEIAGIGTEQEHDDPQLEESRLAA